MASTQMSRIAIRIDTRELLEGDIALQGLGNALDNLARRAKNVEPPKFRKNATRKLKNMVYALASNVISNMTVNTQIGDADRLIAGAEAGSASYFRNYYRLYEMRYNSTGLPIQVGYHAHAYSYSESPSPTFVPVINDPQDMMAQFKAEFMSGYQLGDVFYIGAQGPAYRYIESGRIGQADGIIKPTIATVMATYAFDMQAAYNERARINYSTGAYQ